MRSGRRDAVVISAAAAAGVVLSHVVGHAVAGHSERASMSAMSASAPSMPSMPMQPAAAWSHLAPAPTSVWTVAAVLVLVLAVGHSVRTGARMRPVRRPGLRLLSYFAVLVGLQATACLAVQLVDGHTVGLSIADVVTGPGARVALVVQVVIAAGIAALLVVAERVGAAIARRSRTPFASRRRPWPLDESVLRARSLGVARGRAPPVPCT